MRENKMTSTVKHKSQGCFQSCSLFIVVKPYVLIQILISIVIEGSILTLQKFLSSVVFKNVSSFISIKKLCPEKKYRNENASKSLY